MKEVRSSGRPGPGWTKQRVRVRNSRGKWVRQKRWVPPPTPRPKVEIAKGADMFNTVGHKRGPEPSTYGGWRSPASSSSNGGVMKRALNSYNDCPYCASTANERARPHEKDGKRVITCRTCGRDFRAF